MYAQLIHVDIHEDFQRARYHTHVHNITHRASWWSCLFINSATRECTALSREHWNFWHSVACSLSLSHFHKKNLDKEQDERILLYIWLELWTWMLLLCRIERSKCSFLKDTIEYLGHRVDAKGIQGTQEKIATIERAPMPQKVQQLRSSLGLLNYYWKFCRTSQP